jgi:peptide/nickel transport system substrate-binding protein
MSNNIELLVGSQIYETLLRNNPQTGVPEPWLAQSYDVAPNGTVYTFHLRHGITFQDGTPFTASAVKFSLIRAFTDPNTISVFLANTLTGVNSAYSSSLGDNASKAIDVIDNYTIAFHLSTANSAEPYLFAMANTGISSPSHYNRTLDQYVGTGPFSFVSWARDSNIKLVPNPNYWNKAVQNPNIKSLTFDFFASATAMQSALQAKQVDVALWNFTPTQVNSLSQDSSLTLIKGETARFIALDLNNASAPFNNTLVRQAIAYAINPQQIITTAYGVTGRLSQTLMPPGYQYIMNTTFSSAYQQNLTKAKALLAQAGYPNGFTTTLWYSPTQYGESETPFVTLVQQQLAQVGITLKLNPVEITAFIQASRAGTPPMLSFHWDYDYLGPYQYVYNIMWGGPTGVWAKYMSYNDAQSTALLKQIQTANQTQLPSLYTQLQQRATVTIPLVPIGFIQDIFFTQTYVHGLQVAYLGSSAANGAFTNVTFSQ